MSRLDDEDDDTDDDDGDDDGSNGDDGDGDQHHMMLRRDRQHSALGSFPQPQIEIRRWTTPSSRNPFPRLQVGFEHIWI